MVKGEVLGMLMLAAILTSVTVPYVNAGAFKRRFPIVAANVNIVPQTDDRWNRERHRWRAKDIISVVFLDENGTPKPKTDRPGNADGSKRLIREIQQ